MPTLLVLYTPYLILVRLDSRPAHLNIHHTRPVKAAAHVRDYKKQRRTPLDDLTVVINYSICVYPHRTVVGT